MGSAVSELFTPVFHLEWQKKHKQTHTEVKFESYDFGSLGTPTIDVFWFARNRKEFLNIWELANRGHQIIYFAQNYCDYCIGTANGSMIPGLTDCLE